MTGQMLAMLGVHDLWLFVAAGLVLNVTPGPDLLFVAGNAAAGGRSAGVLAALGVGAGCLLHVTLAAVGLSALLATSAIAFSAVKWIGAGYLIWIGLNMLRSGGGPPQPSAASTELERGRVFWRGALTNALNPKVALFFLAFLPQFISHEAPHKTLGFLLLGLVFTMNGALVSIAVAWLAGAARDRFARGMTAGNWLQRTAGGLFLVLGVRLAAGDR
jgi:threonine/homoserine/homoserine lactone efflux protein